MAVTSEEHFFSLQKSKVKSQNHLFQIDQEGTFERQSKYNNINNVTKELCCISKNSVKNWTVEHEILSKLRGKSSNNFFRLGRGERECQTLTD
ncbi:hypothetical protein SFRURICE_010763 [Spodoptera frugiperda]|nr:hypothetical protein SFRURICE_010763 [Spodoptera frugiperda]